MLGGLLYVGLGTEAAGYAYLVALGVAGIVLAYRPDATEYMRLKAWQRFARR